nr:hypothetical protein [uncultured Mediterranean phage uvMED]
MAITRAQQAKQMLQKGGRIGLKGGADAATASFGKSVGYSDPKTGSTGRPDRDFNPGTGGGGPTFGDAPATTVTGDDVKKAKKKYEQQFFDQGKVPPLGSRPTDLRTKINQRNLQKRLNYINYIQEQIRNKINKGLVDYQEEEGQIEGLTDFDTLESYIDKVQSVQDLVDKGFYKSDGAFAKGQKIPDFPSMDLPGGLGIVQDIFKGPVTSDKLKELSGQLETLEGLKTSEGLGSTTFDELMETYQPNRFKLENPPTGNDDKSMVVTDPCKGPNPPAYCFIGRDADDNVEVQRNLGGLAPRFAGSIFDFTGMADGGRIGAAEGGIMDLETARQAMFLGGIAKGLKKITKGATRAIKKVAKSPVGKAALLGLGAYYMPGIGIKATGGFSEFTKPGGFLSTLLTKGGDKALNLDNLSGLKIAGLLTAAPFLFSSDEEEDKPTDMGPTLTMEQLLAIRANPFQYLTPRITGSQFAAEGGRMGYQEGSKEPVAKKVMPLLDMGGKEMDLRDNGGFVPIGRMEKADDVPARLSKNEFVFTAEAVRNAGDGDVDKGSEVMYNMMKNLESGGEVSEESQGLQGAKEMFQTAQRLEEVI